MVRQVRFAWGDEEAFNAPGQVRRLEEWEPSDEDEGDDDLDLDELSWESLADDDLPPPPHIRQGAGARVPPISRNSCHEDA